MTVRSASFYSAVRVILADVISAKVFEFNHLNSKPKMISKSVLYHIYIYIYVYIYIEDNKYYLNNIMEKVIPKSKTKFVQNFF